MEELLNLPAPRNRGGSSDHRFSLGFAPLCASRRLRQANRGREKWIAQANFSKYSHGKGVGELLRALPSA